MDPTGGFRDRTGHAAWLAKLAIAFIGVSLEDPGVVGQVSLGMVASAIAQVIEHRPWRRRPSKRLVVAHMDSDSAVSVLPLARTGTVVSSPCNRSALRT